MNREPRRREKPAKRRLRGPPARDERPGRWGCGGRLTKGMKMPANPFRLPSGPMPHVAPRRNYWPDAKCAKAFWSQQEVWPYRRLLAHTLDWAAPAAGERWLDLGCGSGPLTRGLWK